MSSKVIFIAGATRGIGFELTKQLSDVSSNTVIASARNIATSPDLKKLSEERSNVKIVNLDVSSESSVSQLDAQLQIVASDGIDTIILNAGIFESFVPALTATREQYLKHYTTNVLGPIEVTKVAYPYLLKRSTRQLFFISSIAGSLTNHLALSSSAYGQSKAALNYTVKELDLELRSDNVTVLAIHPGSVLTDTAVATLNKMGLYENFEQIVERPIQTTESAAGIAKLVNSVTFEQSGQFVNWEGDAEAW